MYDYIGYYTFSCEKSNDSTHNPATGTFRKIQILYFIPTIVLKNYTKNIQKSSEVMNSFFCDFWNLKNKALGTLSLFTKITLILT